MDIRIILLSAIILLVSVAVRAQDVDVPTPIKSVSATFPLESLATFRGKKRIDLFLEVDRDGNVTDVIAFGPWVTCGKNDEMADALQRVAVEAAKKTVFSPASRDGKAVDGYATMSYSLIGTKPALPPTDAKDERRGAVVNGQSLSKPTPKYSSMARKLKIQGAVRIILLLDEEGKPILATADSGHPLLLANAAEAACNARWTPTLLGGLPVKVSAPITYNFTR